MPKTRTALQNLVLLASEGKEFDKELIETIGHVYFQVHPQQINVRDKANGKLIVSIRK